MGAAPATGGHAVLVVGWFPAADDPSTGRFIADQAAAVRATGRARPTVVSFEALASAGDSVLRTRAAEAWPHALAGALAHDPVTVPMGAHGPRDIPVLRLGVTGGTTSAVTSTNQAVHRARALAAYLDARPGRWPALIHVHVGYPEGAAVEAVARPRGIPYLLTEHATYLARLLADPAQRAAYGRAARGAARLIAVGPGLARQIAEAFPDLGERVVVIPNTVDVAAFRPVGTADRDSHELLWVGYRSASKGLPTLLTAFAMVHRQRPAMTLRLIGRSPTDAEEAEWHRLAGALGIADAVRFEADADRSAVAAAMARASVFVHASHLETFGMVAAEALASGLPIAATDSGGVTDILGPKPGRFGALVPPGQPDALAAAIVTTLDRRADFDPHELHAWIAGRYGGAAVAERLVDLYDTVLDEQRPTAGRGDTSRAAPSPTRPTGAWSDDTPVVIVALDRVGLDRARTRQPAWVLAGVPIVTCGTPFPGAHLIAPDLARSMAQLLAGPVGVRRLPAAGRWLLAPLIRRRQSRLERALRPRLEAALREALDEALRGRTDRAWLVCLGGLDILVASGLGDRRAVIAPGGLRWLGDRRWPPPISA